MVERRGSVRQRAKGLGIETGKLTMNDPSSTRPRWHVSMQYEGLLWM